MLLLTRRIGEAIQIGDDIRIMVSEIKGRQVKLAIEAPRSMRIDREEIAKRIREGLPAPVRQENQ